MLMMWRPAVTDEVACGAGVVSVVREPTSIVESIRLLLLLIVMMTMMTTVHFHRYLRTRQH